MISTYTNKSGEIQVSAMRNESQTIVYTFESVDEIVYDEIPSGSFLNQYITEQVNNGRELAEVVYDTCN